MLYARIVLAFQASDKVIFSLSLSN